MNKLEIVLLLSSMVGMVSLTLTRSHLFHKFRDWVDRVTSPEVNAGDSMIYTFVRCPFCVSFWITFLSIFPFRKEWYQLTDDTGALIMYGFVVWCAASVIAGIIMRLFAGGGDYEGGMDNEHV